MRLPNDASELRENTRTAISVGRYTVLGTGSTFEPPHRVLRGGEVTYYPMKIGDHVYIGAGCVVSAASIGSFVHMGKGSVVENGCIVKDQVKILEGSVLAAGMNVPSGVVVGGVPARILGDLPDGWGQNPGVAREGEWVEGGELRELVRSIK